MKNLMMKTQILLVRTERLLASWSMYQSKSKSVMNGAYIKLSPTRKPYDTENIKTYSVKAIPVVFGGMEKDPTSVNPLFSHSPDSHYSIVTASYSMTAQQCHRLTTRLLHAVNFECEAT